ncbi:MAG: hypothetical protein KTR13_09095, partial [Saprospiraceae bacterium]|nr:hypothetical protein [Saprospiraceae bacterium]
MKLLNYLMIMLLGGLMLTASTTPNSPINTMQYTDYPTYEAQWKEVERFEREGLPKSALEVVDRIFAQAKLEQNPPQIYKTLIYQSKYALQLEEDAQLNIVNTFKEEIEAADAPTKQLLQSTLADLYWQYFNANRYQFLNRTATANIDLEDFRTWDLNKIFEESAALFDTSLQPATMLQQIALEDFDAILSEEEGSKTYRPTLYDLLVHRALQFYKNDQNTLNRPSDQFEITDEKALGPIQEFLKYAPKTTDAEANKLKAIQLYQQLITFHQNDAEPDALIQIDLERLEFVRAHLRSDRVEELYESALSDLL